MGSRNRDEELLKLFDALDEKKAGFITAREFTEALKAYGLQRKLIKDAIKFLDTDKDGKLKPEDFLRLKEMSSNLIERALKGQVAIPDWQAFIKDCEEIFEEVRSDKTGHSATYIPQLARVNPEYYAIAVTSVDGQVWSTGDFDVPFTIQSCSKPITYCMAEKSRGVEKVLRHVGHEPSGQAFNAFILDTRNPTEKKPHNPMINAGAIMCASLLEPEAEAADRFDHVLDIWKRLVGGEPLGFDNATYLSELSHADRNFALAYFMKDAGAFEDSMDNSEKLRSHLEFYFQLCSITGNTKQMANAASTLANGGICPFTNDKVFDTHTVRNCLSLMFSCGMYDYSGEFAYSVGLPAKSGVAGCVYAVIPNLLGICVWSPRLDKQGNSQRAVRFFEKLTERYSFHVFDEITGDAKKKNPRLRLAVNQNLNTISEMCYAAANGDLTRIMEMITSGVSVDVADYDGRTPLHLAAAEGRTKVLDFLLSHGASPNPKDRWGTTPRGEAEKYKHQECVDLLLKYGAEL